MKNVLEYLENSSKLYPNKIALEDDKDSVTYRELLKQSKIIGTSISELVLIHEPVIVFMEKNIHAIISFMSVIQAGCYYIYVSPDQPISRIEQIIKVSKSKLVLVEDSLKHRLNNIDINICIYESINNDINEIELVNRRKQMKNVDPVYCNFTSGSTGLPKGVVISHLGVIDFIDEFVDTFNINNDDIIANQAPFDFDVSIKDIYSAFKVGATLVVIPRSYFFLVTKLMDFLIEKKVTTMIWAVSALCYVSQLKGLKYKIPTTVNKVMFSGEVMPIKQLHIWQDALQNAKFINLYGPTEITCNCTYYQINKRFELDEKIPIGKPFNNKNVLLLDENNQLIKDINVVGEMCVTGSSIALGYLNDIERTNQVFVQNPLHNNYREIIYRTGDLAYYNEDNDLVFSGRSDFQIKYMGHRIELEEVETMINSIEGIERSCCLFINEKLVSYYQGTITSSQIKRELKRYLPVYMIPTTLRYLESLPINANGKLNRKMMQEMEENLC